MTHHGQGMRTIELVRLVDLLKPQLIKSYQKKFKMFLGLAGVMLKSPNQI